MKNLFLVILATIVLAALTHSLLTKITGYASIVIYGTVESPQASAQANDTTLTATVQPETESPQVIPTESYTATVATSGQQEEQKQYVNKTLMLQVINQTENLKVKLDGLRTSSREILEYYSSINDTENVEKWINIVVLFNQALGGVEEIQDYAKDVKDSATKESVDVIKGMINNTRKTLNKVVELIKVD